VFWEEALPAWGDIKKNPLVLSLRPLAKRSRRWIQLVALWRSVPAVGFSSSPFGETLPPLDSALRPLAKRCRRWIWLFALWRNVPAVGFSSSPFGEAFLPFGGEQRELFVEMQGWGLFRRYFFD